jgi:hypothetical protein
MFGGISKAQEVNGVPLGRRGHLGHPYDVPWGFEKLLRYIRATWTRHDVNVKGQTIPIFVSLGGCEALTPGDGERVCRTE